MDPTRTWLDALNLAARLGRVNYDANRSYTTEMMILNHLASNLIAPGNDVSSLYHQNMLQNSIAAGLSTNTAEAFPNPFALPGSFLQAAASGSMSATTSAAASSQARDGGEIVNEEPFGRPQVRFMPRRSGSSAYNQLKETVVRAQQRKRQRDAAAAAASQTSSLMPSVDPIIEFPNEPTAASSALPTVVYPDRTASSAAATAASSIDTENDVESSPRAKIRRREEDRIQNETEAATTSTPEQPSRRCLSNSQNQQITGPVRQREHRNCIFCTQTSVQQQPQHPQTSTGPIALHLFNSVPLQTPATTENIIGRSPQIAPVIPVYVPFTNPFHTIHDNYLNGPYQHLQRYVVQSSRNVLPQDYLFVPSLNTPHDPLFISHNVFEGLIGRNNGTYERHHLFGITPEELPIGVNQFDIERHTTRVIFEKSNGACGEGEDYKERCTVCLDDFEIGKEVRLMKCTHIFHPDCIDKWLSYNKKCPVCRMDVDNLL